MELKKLYNGMNEDKKLRNDDEVDFTFHYQI